MEEVSKLKTYEVLIDFRFSVKDSGITDFSEALDFVDDFIVAGIVNLTKLNNVTYGTGSESDESFACGYRLFVVIQGFSDEVSFSEDGDVINDELYHFVENELLCEVQDVFGGSSNGDFTFELIRASETYGISNYN